MDKKEKEKRGRKIKKKKKTKKKGKEEKEAKRREKEEEKEDERERKKRNKERNRGLRLFSTPNYNSSESMCLILKPLLRGEQRPDQFWRAQFVKRLFSFFLSFFLLPTDFIGFLFENAVIPLKEISIFDN